MKTLYQTISFSLIFTAVLASLFLFRVTTITCKIDTAECPIEQSKKLTTLLGSSLFFSKTDTILATLNSDPTFIFDSEKKSFPGTLHLQFTKQNPLYYIKTPEEILTIYSSGFIKKNQHKKDPELTTFIVDSIPGAIILEDSLNTSLHEYLSKFVKSLSTTALSYQKITLTNTTIKVILDDQVIIFLDLKNADTRIKVVPLLINSNQVKEIGDTLREIDLRYTFPVLRIKNEEIDLLE